MIKKKLAIWLGALAGFAGLVGPAIASATTSTEIAAVGTTVAESAFNTFLGVFQTGALWLAIIGIIVLFWVVRFVLGFIHRRK